MKKATLAIAATAGLTLMQGCSSPQSVLNDLKANESVIFGKIKVVNEKGNHMSICHLADSVSGDDGLFVRKVEPGKINLKNISCSGGHHQYTINTKGLTTNVAKAGSSNYFGDVTVSLSPAKAYNIQVEDNLNATKAQLGSDLPTTKSLLKVGTGKTWKKHFVTRSIP